MKGFLKDKIFRFLGLGSLTLLSLAALASCGKTTQDPTVEPTTPPTVDPTTPPTVDPTTPPTVDPIDPVDPTKPVEPTDEEKRQAQIDKANSAIESLADKNFSAKIGADVYLIDEYNCQKNDVFYEANVDKYNVYTLKDAEEQSYTKTETTDYSFAEISVGRWNNIFSIADEIRLNRATTESAYVVKKGFSVPEYEISYTENGFVFANEDNSIEFFDIGKTEVNIPTNIAKEEEYIIKDGKYNLTNLKAVLEKWFNETDITYQKIGAHVEKVLLLDVNDKGLDIYTITNIDDGSCPVISNVSFKGEDINNLFLNKTETTSTNFVDMLSGVTAKQITVHDGITIDDSSSSIVKRANWVLENDNIDAEVIWAYENTGKSVLEGNGYNYDMVCYASNGKYYKYEVNCTDKASSQDDYTGTKLEEISVLIENLDLYEEK